MAKGARASTTKSNNARLKSRVFGPVETARAERLSAKLMELVSQPKPKQMEAVMEMDEEEPSTAKAATIQPKKQTHDTEVDQSIAANSTNSKSSRGRIEKKRFKSGRKASIVFPKYQKSKGAGKSRKK